jgi:hypothetical protein
MMPAMHDAMIRAAVQSADRGFIDRLYAKRCAWWQREARVALQAMPTRMQYEPSVVHGDTC